MSGIIALSDLRLFFRLTKTNRYSPTPHFFLSHSKSPRRTRISPSKRNLFLQKAVEAQHPSRPSLRVMKSVIRLQHGYAQLLLLELSRCTQSRFLHVGADLGLMIFLPSPSQCDKSLIVIESNEVVPRNAQCMVILPRSHSSVSNVLDRGSLPRTTRIG